jgi:hypothetical protein
MFGYLVVGEIIFDGLTARLPLIYFLLKDATWLTDDTRSNLFENFSFDELLVFVEFLKKITRKNVGEEDIDLF